MKTTTTKIPLYIFFLVVLATVVSAGNCTANITGLCSGCRYQDNIIRSVSLSCLNSSLNASECSYSINNFAPVSMNCSDQDIKAEMGWNRLVFHVTDNESSVTNTSMNIWAKKYDSDSFSDYAVIIFTFIATAIIFFLGSVLNNRVFIMISGVSGFVAGYEMLAFSMVAGLFVIFASALFCLGIFFTKNGNPDD